VPKAFASCRFCPLPSRHPTFVDALEKTDEEARYYDVAESQDGEGVLAGGRGRLKDQGERAEWVGSTKGRDELTASRGRERRARSNARNATGSEEDMET
jgi:hypothetical protein